MKKFILSAATAGALALGGAASAQSPSAVVNNIFGYGTPTYSYGPAIPAIVAGTQPYYSAPSASQPYNTVYVDQYGRQVYVDQTGRHVIVQSTTTTRSITGYDAWGRPIYGTTHGGYASNRHWDRDGDGVADAQDRWPDNRFYW